MAFSLDPVTTAFHQPPGNEAGADTGFFQGGAEFDACGEKIWVLVNSRAKSAYNFLAPSEKKRYGEQACENIDDRREQGPIF